jgi:hypothetical protein
MQCLLKEPVLITTLSRPEIFQGKDYKMGSVCNYVCRGVCMYVVKLFYRGMLQIILSSVSRMMLLLGGW